MNTSSSPINPFLAPPSTLPPPPAALPLPQPTYPPPQQQQQQLPRMPPQHLGLPTWPPPLHLGPPTWAPPQHMAYHHHHHPPPAGQLPPRPAVNPPAELPPGTGWSFSSYAVVGAGIVNAGPGRADVRYPAPEAGAKDNAPPAPVPVPAVDVASSSWTAHKTEAGVVYYYNAVTGVSTYEKPQGFRAEPEKVAVQPTPFSMENLAGTDWAKITTNDGRTYYYNSKTKLSSWQIPSDVVELRKKQEEVSKEQELMVPHATVSNEIGASPVTLSSPAVITGGREASSLKVPSNPGSSSALDLIKRKLHDAGSPITSSPVTASSGTTGSELNGSKASEDAAKGLSSESNKYKSKDTNGDSNVSESSSDSDDEENGPSKEDCILQFKEMLKERSVAPFSKWEKELPKILFDPRFKAIPSHSVRRSLFEHFVKTRAEEERKEKRAAQKAAIEAFKLLLEEASEDIDHNTDYHTFRKKWGNDPRFEALDGKDREHFLNERVLPLKKAIQEKVQAERAAAAASFKSMLREKTDVTANSRWSRVKDGLRDDPRYKSVKHDDREVLFNEYLNELKATDEEAERDAKARREEQEKLKERERELRKRKEREEQEIERVRIKIRRKEALTSFQALLVETIKDPQASWTESKTKFEKDPQGRAANADLDPAETERLFREHVKMLHDRCVQDFKSLLAEVITSEAAANKTEDGKTVLDSWSTAKRLLKSEARYNKLPRKERELLWRRHTEDVLRKLDTKEDKQADAKGKTSGDHGKDLVGSKKSSSRK